MVYLRFGQLCLNGLNVPEGIIMITLLSSSHDRFGNTAYLHISVAFIQMLKALSMFGETAFFSFSYYHVLNSIKWLLICEFGCFSACGNICHGCCVWH